MTITVSIETALNLKEAGWVKECVFCSKRLSGELHDGVETSVWTHPLLSEYYSDEYPFESIFLPTTEELLGELKEEVLHGFWKSELCITRNSVFYADFRCRYYEEFEKDTKEALASLWINHPECRKESIAQKHKEE